MNPAPVIYCVTVEDTSDNPEGAAELFNALELDFSSWRDEETKHVRHTVYCADAAVAAILKAVESGELTEARIDQSVTRVLALKIEKGIIR